MSATSGGGVVVHPGIWTIVKKLHNCDTDTQLAKLVGIHRASLYRYISGSPVAARIIVTLSQLTGLPNEAIAMSRSASAGQTARPVRHASDRPARGVAA
jgi:hypothetical protein